MKFDTRTVQARCAALGFNPGPIDGVTGFRTMGAISEALSARKGKVIADLFHVSGLHSVIWHWTAGAKGVIDVEEDSYNGLHDTEGFHPGHWPPEAQAKYVSGKHGASHSLNANTGRIGESMDCMAGAQERPFKWGSNPMTWHHVNSMLDRTAMHCMKYDIPVSRYSTLSHAEIQPTLGVRQKNKWDITILPDMSRPGDAIEVGDRLRDMLRERLK